MRVFPVSLLFMLLCGCSASPGFRVGWEFTLPPTLKNSQTLTPLPALPTTAYAIDAQGPIPMSQRQYFLQAAPGTIAAPPAASPAPTRQLLPMPRESTPASPQPCQSPPCGE